MRRAAAALALALVACSSPARPAPGAGRTADVDALVSAVTTLHSAPFGTIDERAWRADAADVRARAAGMTDDEFLVAVARLANLGDRNGHGGLFPSNQRGLTLWPVRLYAFADGWYVTAAADTSLVGARLDAIGDHPVAEVVAALSPAVPRDNAQSLRARLATYLMVPAFLRGLHVYGALSFTTPSGPRRVTPDEVTVAEYDALAPPGGPAFPPLLPRPSFAPRDDWFWVARRGSVVVAGYERVEPESPDGRRVQWLVARLEEALRTHPSALVLDLRRNPGGDPPAARPLTILLRDAARAGVRVRVLAGRGTYSAAALFLADLRREAPRVRVYGEGTGGGSRTYASAVSRTLPASGLVVQVVTDEATAAGPFVAAVEPDVRVAVTSADYAAGRDPVLAAAS